MQHAQATVSSIWGIYSVNAIGWCRHSSRWVIGYTFPEGLFYLGAHSWRLMKLAFARLLQLNTMSLYYRGRHWKYQVTFG